MFIHLCMQRLIDIEKCLIMPNMVNNTILSPSSLNLELLLWTNEDKDKKHQDVCMHQDSRLIYVLYYVVLCVLLHCYWCYCILQYLVFSNILTISIPHLLLHDYSANNLVCLVRSGSKCVHFVNHK